MKFFEICAEVPQCRSSVTRYTVSRRRRTALSVSCPCLVSVRISRKILSDVCLLSVFSIRCLSVRILPDSILSAVRILSGFCEKKQSVVCLSGRTRTRQRSTLRGVRIFGMIVRRHLTVSHWPPVFSMSLICLEQNVSDNLTLVLILCWRLSISSEWNFE